MRRRCLLKIRRVFFPSKVSCHLSHLPIILTECVYSIQSAKLDQSFAVILFLWSREHSNCTKSIAELARLRTATKQSKVACDVQQKRGDKSDCGWLRWTRSMDFICLLFLPKHQLRHLSHPIKTKSTFYLIRPQDAIRFASVAPLSNQWLEAPPAPRTWPPCFFPPSIITTTKPVLYTHTKTPLRKASLTNQLIITSNNQIPRCHPGSYLKAVFFLLHTAHVPDLFFMHGSRAPPLFVRPFLHRVANPSFTRHHDTLLSRPWNLDGWQWGSEIGCDVCSFWDGFCCTSRPVETVLWRGRLSKMGARKRLFWSQPPRRFGTLSWMEFGDGGLFVGSVYDNCLLDLDFEMVGEG